MPTVKTQFMTARPDELAGVGKSEKGDLYIVFKSGATHHVKYDNPKECEADYEQISNAIESDYGPKLVEPQD